MEKLEFNREEARWDAWKRPYITPCNNHFVLFDTGEFAVRSSDVPIDSRHFYNGLGLSLSISSEVMDVSNVGNGGSVYTPDGEKVAKAHVIYDLYNATRQQIFVVDHERREIYAGGEQIHGYYANKYNKKHQLENVPEIIADRCMVYYSAHNNRPVSKPVKIVRPRKLSKEQRERVKLAQTLVASACALKGLDTQTALQNYDYNILSKLFTTDTPVPEIVPQFTNYELVMFNQNSIPTKEYLEVPYLKF